MSDPRDPRDSDGADLISSAAARARPARPEGAGSIELSGQRLGEARARAVLDAEFARAGLRVQHDYGFRTGTTILALDAFDPVAKVGYQYVSHGDADVVTDFDTTAENELRRLDQTGKIRILVVHDGNVGDEAELAGLAREFLAGLDRTAPA